MGDTTAQFSSFCHNMLKYVTVVCIEVHVSMSRLLTCLYTTKDNTQRDRNVRATLRIRCERIFRQTGRF